LTVYCHSKFLFKKSAAVLTYNFLSFADMM